MAARVGYCSFCNRSVYLSESEDETCPVCSSEVMIVESGTQRASRLGRNEVFFRDANEELISTSHAQEQPLASFVCECSDRSCSELIRLSLADYEEVRSNSAFFIIKTGHAVEDIEEIVKQTPAYEVVEKTGVGRQVAEQHDPRD